MPCAALCDIWEKPDTEPFAVFLKAGSSFIRQAKIVGFL